VIAFACHPFWRTGREPKLAGPRAFGFELDYCPIERIKRPAFSVG
jgi:hypothetical protein